MTIAIKWNRKEKEATDILLQVHCYYIRSSLDLIKPKFRQYFLAKTYKDIQRTGRFHETY